MKEKVALAAILAMLSGTAFAAADAAKEERPGMQDATPERQMEAPAGVDPAKEPELGAVDDPVKPHLTGVPITEHQVAVVREFLERFDAIDTGNDGYITFQEAQQLPELANWWEREGLAEDHQLDRAEFAQFEAQLETGTDIYTREGVPGDIPVTEHQEEAVREDVPPTYDEPRPTQEPGVEGVEPAPGQEPRPMQ
jgi:hypothetical protein